MLIIGVTDLLMGIRVCVIEDRGKDPVQVPLSSSSVQFWLHLFCSSVGSSARNLCIHPTLGGGVAFGQLTQSVLLGPKQNF